MENNMKILLFAVTTFVLSISCQTFAFEKVIFTVDLFRHGDRMPVADIPLAPYDWPYSLGVLTPKGKKQLEEQGIELRKEYIEEMKFLPEHYDKSAFYIRATESNRTIESARHLLIGLYPFENADIQVDVVSKNNDPILVFRPSGESFRTLQSKQWIEKVGVEEKKPKFWSELSGLAINSFESLNKLSDNLFVRKLYQINLPRGFNEQSADEIISLAGWGRAEMFKIPTENIPMGRLFLDELLIYMEQAINKSNPLKSVIFLAHESTIMSVMASLGTALDTIPPYASRLHFSLIESNNDNKHYFVKVKLNNELVKFDESKLKLPSERK